MVNDYTNFERLVRVSAATGPGCDYLTRLPNKIGEPRAPRMTIFVHFEWTQFEPNSCMRQSQ